MSARTRRTSRSVCIDGRHIGPDEPPYVICELSGNHNGSLERMLALVDAAAATGCDAIKIQSYTPDTLTLDHDGEGFRLSGGLWDGRTLHELYTEAHTPFEWHPAIFARARALGVTLFSTPFDESATDMLAGLDAPAYKIASFEIVDLPLIAHVARRGRPLIISTGIANVAEIDAAVRTARDAGCEELVLLHCISAYPAPVAESNLRTIPNLAETFDVVAGLSDHTPGTAVAVASVALGGAVIEKHFTLSRDDGGPDAAFSMEPAEFTRLCGDCRDAWQALGEAGYRLEGSEIASVTLRRSLYAVADIAAGEPFTAHNVRSIRPGHGLAPEHLEAVRRGVAARALTRGTPLDWDCVERRSAGGEAGAEAGAEADREAHGNER